MPGITSAFMEMKEDKSGQRAIIQISDDIKGNIFAHVMEFLYTGNHQIRVASHEKINKVVVIQHAHPDFWRKKINNNEKEL